MIHSRLFLILRTFTPAEFREFGKFVCSTYNNPNKAIERLYNYLKNHYPRFSSHTFKTQIIFPKIYPGSEYNPAMFHNVISGMISLAEDFIVSLDYKEDSFENKKRLLNQLNKRNLDKHFEKNMTEAFTELNQIKVKDENYYYKKFNLENLKFEFYSTRTPIGKSQPLFVQRKDLIDHFMYYFLITMLKEYFDTYNAEGLVKFDHKFIFFEEIMEHISRQKKDYQKILLIDILHRFLILYRKDQDEKFEDELKILIENNKGYLHKNDYRNFILELYNYYKDKEEQGIKNYGTKSFKLMNEMLTQGMFFQKDGLMSAHTYINLVSSALRQNELGWAENFINEYKSKVQPDQRENAYMYSYATFYYVKGEKSGSKSKPKHFTTALGYLARVKSEDFYYMIRIKNTLIRIYYDLEDYELAISITDSYKHFLSKTKVIPENLYEQYYNFIGFTGKLIKIKTQTSHMLPAVLKDEINSTKLVAYRGWLLEKITELQNRSK